MGATAAYNSQFLVTAQPAIPLTDEAMTDSGDHQTYSITYTAKQYLDINTPVIIQKQTHGTGSWVTVSNYTLKHVGAIVTFASANNNDDLIRIHSAAYYAYSALGQGHTAEAASKIAAIDVTSFNPTGVETYIGGELNGQVKFDRWWLDKLRMASLTARDLVVVSLVMPSGARYEGYAFSIDLTTKSDVKSAVGESLTFQITNEFFASLGGILVTIQDVDILQVGGVGVGASNPLAVFLAVAGSAISNSNPVPTQDVEQSGYVAASSPPSATNVGSDTTYTFSSQVNRVIIQNNTSANVNYAFDTAASAGSFVLASNAMVVYPKKVTALHLYTAAAQNINGTSAGNIVVLGAL